MNEALGGPAVAVASPEAPAFDKLHKHLASPAGEDALHELIATRAAVEEAGASHAAARLSQLDDYATALPPETIPRLVDTDRILDELEEVSSKRSNKWVVWRNILALVPLLLTWASLSWATSAYRDQIQHDPNRVYQPFLVLWENGFDHRIWLTFSTVALLDTVLFAMLIFMTWRIHTLEREDRKSAGELAARVDYAVTALVAALCEQRWLATNNPGDWAAAVQQVIDRAMQETRELNKANQQALESARLAIKEAKQSHSELVRELGGELAEALVAVRAENKRVLEETAVGLRDMLTQVFDGQKQIADESLATITEARRATEQSNERAQSTLAELKRESVETLRGLHRADRQFLVDIGGETRDLLQGFHSELELYRQSASTLASSIGQIGDVAVKLGANAEIFSDTAKAMDEHVRSVAQSQERFAGMLAETASATRGAVDNMNGAAAQMRDTTAQMHDVLVAVSGKLSPQLQHMGAQVQSASDILSQTQARLAETSAGLARAAEYFRNMPRPRVVLSLFSKSSS